MAIPPRTAEALKTWLNSAVSSNPEGFVFAGEGGRPVWRDTLLYDHIRPKLKPLGLEWVDFQVMRSTNATLGQQAKVDPKAASDQRGHGIGVSLDVYSRTPLKSKAAAARRLEDAVLATKIVPIRKRA